MTRCTAADAARRLELPCCYPCHAPACRDQVRKTIPAPNAFRYIEFVGRRCTGFRVRRRRGDRGSHLTNSFVDREAVGAYPLRSGAGSSAVPLLPIQLRRTQDIRCRPSGLFLPNVACNSFYAAAPGQRWCRGLPTENSSRSEPVDRPMLGVSGPAIIAMLASDGSSDVCGSTMPPSEMGWISTPPSWDATLRQAQWPVRSGLDGSPIPLREGATAGRCLGERLPVHRRSGPAGV